MAHSNCYIELSEALPGKVALPGEASYQNPDDGYYTKQQDELQPICVVHPSDTAEVSKVIRVLNTHDVQFAVRCGGHSSNMGASNIQDGVTINLRNLSKVELDFGKSAVQVSGGSKWHDVYSMLQNHGLATSGGRLSDVGVGGLTSGGGISYFSGRYGLVCDNVQNYEVVLANGEVVEANQHHNSDLWRALKGGSSNFGIVTRFDLRVFPQGSLLGGIIVYPSTAASRILRSLCHLTVNFDPNSAAIISLSWSADNSRRFVFAHYEYTQEETKPEALAPFLDVQPQYQNTMKISSLTEVTELASKYSPKGGRSIWATMTVKCDPDFLVQAHELWQGKQTGLESIAGRLDAASDGPLILLLLTAKWADSADDAHMRAAVKHTLDEMESAAKAAGTYHRFKYLNYAADWQDPIEGYGAENKAQLQAVSRKYDPEGVFQTKVSGGFKVF